MNISETERNKLEIAEYKRKIRTLKSLILVRELAIKDEKMNGRLLKQDGYCFYDSNKN